MITRDAYSDEVISCGFWPGNDQFPEAAFYSYAYPAPIGFEKTRVPVGAYYLSPVKEFILPYDVVRNAENPENLISDFFQRTYESEQRD